MADFVLKSPPALPPASPPPRDFYADIVTAWTVILTAHGACALVYLIFCLTVPRRRGVRYRERLHAWLVISRLGIALTALHALCSLASCVLFICEGYLVPADVLTLTADMPGGYRTLLPLSYLLVEQTLQPIFLFHYLLLFYVAGSQRCAYVFSLMSVIDIGARPFPRASTTRHTMR
jgi:hypothetical protein